MTGQLSKKASDSKKQPLTKKSEVPLWKVRYLAKAMKDTNNVFYEAVMKELRKTVRELAQSMQGFFSIFTSDENAPLKLKVLSKFTHCLEFCKKQSDECLGDIIKLKSKAALTSALKAPVTRLERLIADDKKDLAVTVKKEKNLRLDFSGLFHHLVSEKKYSTQALYFSSGDKKDTKVYKLVQWMDKQNKAYGESLQKTFDAACKQSDEKVAKSSLDVAVAQGDGDLVRFLLERAKDAKVAANATCGHGSHSLICSSLNSLYTLFGWRRIKNITVLMLAAALGETAIVTALLEYKADAKKGGEVQNGQIWYPLDLAQKYGHRDVVDVLSKTNAYDYLDLDSIAQSALKKGRSDIAIIALEASARLNHDFGTVALVRAAALDARGDVVTALLERKADVNEAKKITKHIGNIYMGGQTALMRAAGVGHSAVVDILLERKAEVNRIDVYGQTALMKAAMNGHDKIVTTLLNANADVSMRDQNGKTALDLAKAKGHKSIITKLSEHKPESVGSSVSDEKASSLRMKR